MLTARYLTDGGIPNDWTVANLQWLAKTHRHHAAAQVATRTERSAWHIRWAAFIEDLLETRLANH